MTPQQHNQFRIYTNKRNSTPTRGLAEFYVEQFQMNEQNQLLREQIVLDFEISFGMFSDEVFEFLQKDGK